MPGAPVTLGCAVTLSPGAAGPPDSGVVISVPQAFVTVAGMPLATTGSRCQMVNAVSGALYSLPIPTGPGTSRAVRVAQQGLVRVGDQIPAGAGVLTILGPPAAPFINDEG